MPDATEDAPAAATSDRFILSTVAGLAGAFVLFGLLVDGPRTALQGLVAIQLVRDTLVTDYIGVGGKGAAFLNAGLLTLVACGFYWRCRAKMTGGAVAALLLVLGFALFGKNLLNVWPIVGGVWLYCRLKGEAFGAHLNTAFFGCALAPVVSEILFSTTLSPMVTLPLAVATGIGMGLVLVPVAAQLFKAHGGLSLYNMGFAAGILGTLVVALYRSYGFVPAPVFIWTRGNNLLLGAFLFALFAALAALGLWHDRGAARHFRSILRMSGQAPADFIGAAGFGATLVNMGVSGALGTLYLVVIGGDLNGPTIGALMTIVGFAAAGKHPANFLPVMIGVFIGTLAKPWNAHDPSLQLAALFGTTLAPIAGRFGWHWGIVAGFIHSSAALAVGDLHGGLVLYNNGFAAGLVASVLGPVVAVIKGRKVEA
ncbi:DUF1576 domain-containing protein [Kaistia geumhonensis]|uniref:DUF1576 domain-containing protein n=1 Tax=Kaistia geumhonensis TaxID=410839 RepID=A0ABU0M2E1_9HYPH|nr:DUF1576 domain-containing protein [Kaistia geumhonensis]MCX5479657.1 DUF1576 domain-containing protein [Kaistia geumhonensis]MDQ0515119.1 hypothetical protein [Kaistia geumhonensis]